MDRAHIEVNRDVKSSTRVRSRDDRSDLSSERHQWGVFSLVRGVLTSPRYVFSIRALTIRAARSSVLSTSSAVMMGVEMVLAALIISLIRGTPRVTFMEATPAKWKVLSVICVPGSPID